MTLSLRTDRSLIRGAASSTRYVLATISAPEAPPRSDRLPVNVALVLDRSGSMSGEQKFELARKAAEQAIHMLSSEDRFTLVVYDETIDVLVASSLATPDAKRRAVEALNTIRPRGSTDLCSGWLRGCEGIAACLEENMVVRALLLTDGLANHGETSREKIALHARELRQRGIATSTFGVGEDFDERLLRDMAREGGGHFYFIDSPAQIADILTSELGEALETVVRRAVLQVSLPHGIRARPLNPLRHTLLRGDNELRIELGDLASAQEVRVVIRMTFRRGELGDTVMLRGQLTGQDGAVGDAAEVSWRYADHLANDRQERDRIVDREVARIYASMARNEATEFNRAGDYDQAQRAIERTIDRIRQYAGDDAEIGATWAELQDEMPRWVRQMGAHDMKVAYCVAESVLFDRAVDGKARKRLTRSHTP
ncbi:MAG TPA: VWA domain-containing protein [Gemmatimonadaceae bacterium]|nr:VWA domain-containing protein [Gemmatimonadaceae bacterium]